MVRDQNTGMDNFTFGITIIVVGMGGTLLTLWILSLLMIALKRLFPYKGEEGTNSEGQ
jgi:hypothetical protein